jgi:hypothetical protein
MTSSPSISVLLNGTCGLLWCGKKKPETQRKLLNRSIWGLVRGALRSICIAHEVHGLVLRSGGTDEEEHPNAV